jgi:hypothetical protein
MLYIVIEEVWSISVNDDQCKILSSSDRPLFAGEKQAADEYAKRRAGEFKRNDFEGDAKHPYWWGRNEGEPANHHFVVKPALPASTS